MTGITISSDIIQSLIGNKALSNSAFRVLLYLMTNHQPVSTADISAAVGISQKAVCKSIRRLTDAGILQAGELEARRRRFNIPGAAIPEASHEPVPEHDKAIVDRMGTMGEHMGAMAGTIQALVDTIQDLQVTISTMKAPQTVSSAPAEAVNVPVEIPSEGTPIISLAKQAAFLNNSIAAAAEFKELFGISPPAGADPLAVAEMIRRRQSGKLDNLKSPLGYLASLAGKITPTPAADTVYVPVSSPAEKDDMAIRNTINQLWQRMTDEELEPYRQKAREKSQSDGHKKVAIELLTRQIFNNEQLAAYR